MAKTNYTKVEEVLEKELRRQSIEKLFDDKAQSHKQPAEGSPPAEKGGKSSSLDKAQMSLISALKRDIKFLRAKQHATMYTKLGIKRNELKQKIENPADLTAEEWVLIQKIKTKIDLYKAELAAQMPEFEFSQQIEHERQKHINKRFNVNEKWLPLH